MKGLAPDEGADGVEAAVEVQRGEHCFQGRGEDGVPGTAAAPVLAPAEAEGSGKVEPLRPVGEGAARDQLRASLGQGTGSLVRRGRPQEVGDYQPQNRVTQEGQALVVAGRGMLVGPGGMGQGLAQEVGDEEPVTEPVLQGGERIVRRQPR